MQFHTRKWVKPEDLNPNGTLFGGTLLSWIDEEAALCAIIELNNNRIVTKSISQIDFQSSARQGDIIEIGIEVVKYRMASIVMACEVRNIRTQETILTIDNIVMANLDNKGRPKKHSKSA